MEGSTGINGPSDADAAMLDASLRGSLPCVQCGYELQGLSIRGACPECGMAIRATILHRVDPQAEAFRPLPTPRLTASAVLLWPLGAIVAALFAWIPRVRDMIADVTGATLGSGAGWEVYASLVGLAISALGALGLIRPTRETPRARTIAAAFAVVCYVPLGALWWWIVGVHDQRNFTPYLDADPDAQRLAARLGVALLAVAILLLLRWNARQMVARSLVLRTGRVDRQTIYATVGAIALAASGDIVALVSVALGPGDRTLLASAGALLVLIGSMMTTAALAGATIDGWRIRRALVMPGPRFSELVEISRTQN